MARSAAQASGGGEGSSHAAVMNLPGDGRGFRGFGSKRSILSGPTRATPLWQTSSGGAQQLLVYHFMFGPDYTAECPACSSIADGFNGFVVHLANHDVTLTAMSRAPLKKLAGVQAADGVDVSLGILAR